MSQPQEASRAKLVIGFLVRERTLASGVVAALDAQFGPLDLVSPWLPFDYTDYYAREMGSPLHRRLLTYEHLVAQDILPAIKHTTNQIEATMTDAGRRLVNIDPGLLSAERFVLATGKNFPHRIYLRRGIYADLTLIYRKGGFQSLPWTYPDYREARLQQHLLQARCKLQRDLAAPQEGRQEASGPRDPKGVG